MSFLDEEAVEEKTNPMELGEEDQDRPTEEDLAFIDDKSDGDDDDDGDNDDQVAAEVSKALQAVRRGARSVEADVPPQRACTLASG